MMESPLILSLAIAMAINGLVYLIAFSLQTDKLTDFTYSLTFVTLSTYFLYNNFSATNLVIAILPIIWGLRLGSYLFYRILHKGKDYRFDSMRKIWWKFGGFWLLQALSIWIISMPYVLALSKASSSSATLSLSILSWIGVSVFALGLIIETIADYQKFKFKRKEGNKDKYISTGLYSIVRHPNYSGEILVWVGIFIACIPFFNNYDFLSIIGPLWIIFLLIKISGIPYLKVAQDERYGHLASYQKYKRDTKQLIPSIY